MLEHAVHKLVESQIEQGALKEEDRNLYRYGYQILIEFAINIIVSIFIAVFFRAFDIVIVFTAAYILIRGCAGGYHAKTSLGCFCVSACMLIGVILLVQYIDGMGLTVWMPFVPEIFITPCIFAKTPIPDPNRPISENERVHFKRKVKQLYCLELAAAVLLQWFGKTTCALTILAVHMIIFIMVILHILQNCKAARTA